MAIDQNVQTMASKMAAARANGGRMMAQPAPAREVPAQAPDVIGEVKQLLAKAMELLSGAEAGG